MFSEFFSALQSYILFLKLTNLSRTSFTTSVELIVAILRKITALRGHMRRRAVYIKHLRAVISLQF